MTFLRQVGVSLVALATLLPANLASAGAIELKLRISSVISTPCLSGW